MTVKDFNQFKEAVEKSKQKWIELYDIWQKRKMETELQYVRDIIDVFCYDIMETFDEVYGMGSWAAEFA